jgi:hypothetical protein
MARRIIIILAVLVLLPPLEAQQYGQPLPTEDPRLYQVFLHFHDNVSSAIQTKKGQDPDGGGKAEKGFAHMLRIKEEELSKVTAIAHGFATDIAKWQSDLKAYVDQVRSQKKQPDPAVLLQFDQRKLQLINAAVLQLTTTLSPASWTGLHGYINEEHRLHTSVLAFESTPNVPPR